LSKQSTVQKKSWVFQDFQFGFIFLCFIAYAILSSWDLKSDIEIYFAMLAALTFGLSYIKKEQRLRLNDAAVPLTMILAAQSLLYFAGMFYAAYPQHALKEFFLNIGGLLIFLTVYIRVKEDQRNIRRLLELICFGMALISLVSIDLATTKYTFPLWYYLSAMLGAPITESFGQFEQNTRITSAMEDPNIFAATVIVGMFLSLLLYALAEDDRKAKTRYLSYAMVCGSAFVLCFSLGAFLALVPALLFALWLAPRGNRGKLALTTAICLAASFFSAAAVFVFRDLPLLPLIIVPALSAGASLLIIRGRPGFLPKPNPGAGPKKTVLLVCLIAGAALLCAVFFVRGPYALKQGDGFRRAVRLQPGSYEVTADIGEADSGSVSVAVASMSYTQAALKEQTALAAGTVGSGDKITFTVPDDSAAVFFNITADSDLSVEGLRVSGEREQKSIPLQFKLVPEFIVNRLQGLWVNDNAMQRFVFFRDGIRMGLQSPVVGLGGGAFQGYLMQTADYYYVTVHAHNQYIQSFVDGGVIGFLLFLALAVVTAAALLTSRKDDKVSVYLPYIGAAAAFIFINAMLQVDFMQPAFRLTASIVLALAAALTQKPAKMKKPAQRAVSCAAFAVVAVTLYLSIGRLSAIDLVSKPYGPNELRSAMLSDPVNGNDYRINYLLGTMNEEPDAQITRQSEEYLQKLESSKSNSNNALSLAQYYLQKNQPDTAGGVAKAEEFIGWKRVDAQAWDRVFRLYMTALEKADDDGRGILVDSVLTLCDYLKELNATLPKKTVPSLAASEYIWAVSQKNGGAGLLADSRTECDLNLDGTQDIVTGGADGVVYMDFMTIGIIPDQPLYVKVYQPEEIPCALTIYDLPHQGVYDKNEGCYVWQIEVGESSCPVHIEMSSAQGAYFTVSQ